MSTTDAILEAITAGASGDDIANLELPESYRAVFVNADEHGVAVQYWTRAGVNHQFNAIFENDHEAVAFGEMSSVATQSPRLTLRQSDLPPFGGDGDTVIINTVRYRRAGAPEDDGTGMVMMRLEKQ